MKTYLFYIVGLVVLMACLAVSIQAHLLWPSIALGTVLLWLCASLYSRMNRLLYAYRETEKENEPSSVYITADGQTGELLSLSSWYYHE